MQQQMDEAEQTALMLMDGQEEPLLPLVPVPPPAALILAHDTETNNRARGTMMSRDTTAAM